MLTKNLRRILNNITFGITASTFPYLQFQKWPYKLIKTHAHFVYSTIEVKQLTHFTHTAYELFMYVFLKIPLFFAHFYGCKFACKYLLAVTVSFPKFVCSVYLFCINLHITISLNYIILNPRISIIIPNPLLYPAITKKKSQIATRPANCTSMSF